VYSLTGAYTNVYEYTYYFLETPITAVASEECFMWAYSSDGLSWTVGGYDTSKTYGQGATGLTDGMGAGVPFHSVAFGAGKFVAAVHGKNGFNAATSEAITNLIFLSTICAVAVSTDGASWSRIVLPGASTSGAPGLVGPLNGLSRAVAFCKTSGTDENGYPKGFFATVGYEQQIAATEGGGSITYPVVRTKLWTSHDGTSWTLVETNDRHGDFPLNAIAGKNLGTIVTL